MIMTIELDDGVPADFETENARLRRELREALEQQTATRGETAAKRHDQVVSLIAEDKERSAVLFRENTINRGARLFDETYNRYTGLGQMLESSDPREQYKAALTLEMGEVLNLLGIRRGASFA
jgi:hypothetical protein